MLNQPSAPCAPTVNPSAAAPVCACCGSTLTTFHQQTFRGAGYTDARCVNKSCLLLNYSFDLTHYDGSDVAELARRQSNVAPK